MTDQPQQYNVPANAPAYPLNAGTPTEPTEPAQSEADTATTKAGGAAVGDVVRFTSADPINGQQVSGFAQVLDVDTDDDGNRRYTVARLDVLGGQLTDDDLVSSED